MFRSQGLRLRATVEIGIPCILRAEYFKVKCEKNLLKYNIKRIFLQGNKMKPLPKNVLNEVKKLLMEGKSTRYVATKCSISQTSVIRLKKKCQLYVEKPPSGRPKKLSNQDERSLARYVLSGTVSTGAEAAKELENATGKRISRWTANRSLRKLDLEAVEKKKKPALSRKNVKARLSFAKTYGNWSEEMWRKVIWSDETKINRYCTDGRSWAWKRKGESLKPKHVKQTVKHGGGSIMLWGCMSAFGVGEIHLIEGKMDQHIYKNILRQKLMKTIRSMPLPASEITFQHDRDPKHMAKSVQAWLQTQPFSILDWPAQSPDLNPIENLWAYLKTALHKEYDSPPSSMAVLWDRVQEQWAKIPTNYCSTLAESETRRIQAVKKTKGLWTKY